jgi:hypothetical protein
MKKVGLCVLFWLAITIGWAQGRKLTKEEEAQLTSDQKLVRETDRKSKRGKKKISTRKKVKIQVKQARRAGKVKQRVKH